MKDDEPCVSMTLGGADVMFSLTLSTDPGEMHARLHDLLVEIQMSLMRQRLATIEQDILAANGGRVSREQDSGDAPA